VLQRDAADPLEAWRPRSSSAAYDGYIGYCGRYNVNEEERSVTFQLELSSYPNWTGSTQKRFVEGIGTRLRVNTPPIPVRGKQMVTNVIWERQK
jgi:Lipocalin-like domain